MDDTRPHLETRMTAFRQRCAELGLALTPQRLAIYRAVAATDAHPSAEEIFRQVKPDVPSLSLGTVYRTLEMLEEQGLISRVHAFGDQARFDANLDPHHHLVCVRCRRVLDFHFDGLDRLLPGDGQLHGFRVLAHRVQVVGVCPGCQE